MPCRYREIASWLNWLPATGYAPSADGLLAWASHLVLPVIVIEGLGFQSLGRSRKLVSQRWLKTFALLRSRRRRFDKRREDARAQIN